MKKNLDHKTVRSLYWSLAREASEFWNWDFAIPEFRIKNLYENPFGSGGFETPFFSSTPDVALAQTNFNLIEAQNVTFNRFYIPFLWEDEVICTILHELAHVNVGIIEQHNAVWAKAADDIGSVGQATFATRSVIAEEIPWLSEDFYEFKRRCNIQPTLGSI